MSESPYRARGRPRKPARSLSFFHARFSVLVVVVLVIAGAGLGAIDMPHDFQLRCVPSSEPRLDCVSSQSRPLRSAKVERTSLTPEEIESRPILLLNEPEPASFEQLSATPSFRGSCWTVVVSWGAAKRTVHQDCSDSGDEPSSLVEFERALRQGEPAVLKYRSGWGGFHMALPLWFVTLCFLWLGSGRTRVTLDSDAGDVVVQSRAFWRVKAEEQRFLTSSIAEVFMLASTLENGANIFRPAFRDPEGKVLPLGTMGLAPERAAHFVRLLQRMLAADSELDRG